MTLPVFKAFFATLGYLGAHFFTIVRILWLPMLLVMGVNWLYMSATIDLQSELMAFGDEGVDPSAAPSFPVEAVGAIFLSVGLLYLAMAILYPMMFAGVLRHLVRGEAPKLPFYVRFGGDEFRILLAFIMVIALTSIVGLVGMLALFIIGFIAAVLSEAVGGILMVVLFLAFFVAVIWFMLRLSIAFGAVVGERSVGIAESWRLTKGNAWRLFFFWLLVWLVMLAVSIVYFISVAVGMAPLFFDMIATANDAEAIAGIQRRLLEMQRDLIDASAPGFWVYSIATYCFMIIYTALWAAASGVAYRFLSGVAREAH